MDMCPWGGCVLQSTCADHLVPACALLVLCRAASGRKQSLPFASALLTGSNCCLSWAGEIWPAVPGGGPGGQLPPHKFKVMFKDGGMGTLYPLFYALRQRAQRADAAARQAEATGSNALAANSKMVQEMVHKA